MNINDRTEIPCYTEWMRQIYQGPWTRYGVTQKYYAVYLDNPVADLLV